MAGETPTSATPPEDALSMDISHEQEGKAVTPSERAESLSDAAHAIRTSARRAMAASLQLRERLEASRSDSPWLSLEQRAVFTQIPRDEEMLDLVPDGYLVTDENGIIHSANRAATLLIAVPLAHLVGKPLFNFVDMRHRHILRRLLLIARAPDAPPSGAEFVRITPRRREGFDASLRFTPVRDTDTGELVGGRWLVRDLTERSRAEMERYRLMVNAVEDYAVMLLDEDARIIGWNRGAELIFGYTEEEALKLSYQKLFPEDQQDTPGKEIAGARATGSFREEEWMVRKNGETFYAQGVLLALPSHETGSAGYAKILRDRTEARNQEEALRLSEARLQIAFKASGAVPWDWDLRTDTVTWQRDYWTLSGLDPERDAPGYESWRKSLHPDDRERAVRLVQEAIDTGCELINEYRIAHPPEGTERWLLSLGKALQDSDGKAYRLTGITMDITERKRVEQELAQSRRTLEERVRERTAELTAANIKLHNEIEQREQVELARQELAKQLVRAQEAERQRISRDLHDHMGQHLTAFALGLGALESTVSHDPTAKEKLAYLRQITDTLGSDLHRLAVELRPTALDDLGLIRALSGYVENWSERSGISVDFEVSGVAETERMPREVETALYRIVQESLTNAAKYSEATHMSVLLTRQPAQLLLIVEDNGRGFERERKGDSSGYKDSKSPRLGLAGMEERAVLLGGTLTIESAPGNGTTIFVRLPLPNAAE